MDIVCKKPRKPRPKNCSIDRLSRLPDDVLHHILSFVDVLDAVRTSVLSRRWMNVWLSAPCWNFSMDRYLDHYYKSNVYQKLAGRDKFWQFINWALAFKALCQVKRISLSFEDTMVNKLNALLVLAGKHKVQEICLTDGDYDSKNLLFPGALCETLTSLTINFRDIIGLKAARCFRSLRSLYLRGVALPDDTVEKLFSCNSTYLEDVYLEGCKFKDCGLVNIYGDNLRNLTIANLYCFTETMWAVSSYKYSLNVYAPNLVSFTYIGPMLCGFNLSKSTSLKQALIRIMYVPQSNKYSHKYNLLASPTKFVGLDPSRSLTLSSLVVKHSSQKYSDIHMGNFMLANLNCLKVGLRYHVDYLKGLINLLCFAPNLEALVVRFREERHNYWAKRNQKGGSLLGGSWSWRGGIRYIPSLSHHLKRVEISGTIGSNFVLELVRFLLQTGKVLEKVEIQFRSQERDQNVFCKLVAALPKASPKVAISFHAVHIHRKFNWFQHGDSDPDNE